jgi:hypothetical protein
VGPPPDWQPDATGAPDAAEASDGGAPASASAATDASDAPDTAPTPLRPGASGRGLGLTIVRDVMARHGGRLVLQPRHPHGLVARLEFPQHPQRAQQPAGQAGLTGQAGPQRAAA